MAARMRAGGPPEEHRARQVLAPLLGLVEVVAAALVDLEVHAGRRRVVDLHAVHAEVVRTAPERLRVDERQCEERPAVGVPGGRCRECVEVGLLLDLDDRPRPALLQPDPEPLAAPARACPRGSRVTGPRPPGPQRPVLPRTPGGGLRRRGPRAPSCRRGSRPAGTPSRGGARRGGRGPPPRSPGDGSRPSPAGGPPPRRCAGGRPAPRGGRGSRGGRRRGGASAGSYRRSVRISRPVAGLVSSASHASYRHRHLRGFRHRLRAAARPGPGRGRSGRGRHLQPDDREARAGGARIPLRSVRSGPGGVLRRRDRRTHPLPAIPATWERTWRPARTRSMPS